MKLFVRVINAYLKGDKKTKAGIKADLEYLLENACNPTREM